MTDDTPFDLIITGHSYELLEERRCKSAADALVLLGNAQKYYGGGHFRIVHRDTAALIFDGKMHCWPPGPPPCDRDGGK